MKTKNRRIQLAHIVEQGRFGHSPVLQAPCLYFVGFLHGGYGDDMGTDFLLVDCGYVLRYLLVRGDFHRKTIDGGGMKKCTECVYYKNCKKMCLYVYWYIRRAEIFWDDKIMRFESMENFVLDVTVYKLKNFSTDGYGEEAKP